METTNFQNRAKDFIFIFAILSCLLFLFNILYAQNLKTSMPLERLLNPDGTLKLEDGYSGSLDPSGWRMITGRDGQPRFLRSELTNKNLYSRAVMTSGDENWSGQFTGFGVSEAWYGSTVEAIAIDGNDVYIGGYFQRVGGVWGITAKYIAKWSKDSGWSSLGSGAEMWPWYVQPLISAIAVSGNDVYVGGVFYKMNGDSASNIAKWDGTGWSRLGSGVNAGVTQIAVSGTNVYVIGGFNKAGGLSVDGMAKWDGSSWSALANYVGYGVSPTAIATSGDDVYVGGNFGQIGGVPAKRIAKWDGQNWSALGSGVGNGALGMVHIRAIATSGNDVYVGGRFLEAGGIPVNHIAKWNGNSWSSLGSGITDDETCYVEAIAINGNNIYVGGDFNEAGGVPVNRIAKWDGSSWSALGNGVSGGSNGEWINVIAIGGNDVYVGGRFPIAGEGQVDHIAIWDGNRWWALGNGLNDAVRAIATNSSDVYVGGDFTLASSLNFKHIAKWDGDKWQPLGAGLMNGTNGSVNAIAINGSDVFVGGAFTKAGDINVNYIARWDGSTWFTLGSGMNNIVKTLAVNGSDLLAGGTFTMAGGVSTNYIAKWDGSSWSGLGSGISTTTFGEVNAIAVSGGDLYIGGLFKYAGGINANNIVKWDGSNWSALGNGISDPNGKVYTIDVCGDDVYVGGLFAKAGGVSVNHIARWDGNNWFALGDGMYRLGGACVYALAVYGNDIYAGGLFTKAGDLDINYVAKWDGISWSSLGSGMNTDVRAIAINEYNLFVGGFFTMAGGKVSLRFGQWKCQPIKEWCITGKITHHLNNQPVDEVKVKAIGTLYEDMTGENGDYRLLDLPMYNYVVRPEKENDISNVISALDAAWILQHNVGLRPFTAYQMIAGDVTGNGSLSAYDAARILQRNVGLINKFPIMPDTTHFWRFVPEDFAITPSNWTTAPDSTAYTPLTSDTTDNYVGIIYGDVTGNWHPSGIALASLGKSSAGTVDIRLEAISGEAGEKIILPVILENGLDILAISFTLEYDAKALKILSVSTTEITEGWQIAYNVRGDLIKVAMAGSKPIPNPGAIVNLEFEVLKAESHEANSPLNISEILINEGNISVNIRSAKFAKEAPLPKKYVLSQNYPNPFNPETIIRYQVPQDCLVRLRIYNLMGQEIKALLAAPVKAGHHQIKWDGKDACGKAVSSGIYLYILETDNVTITKKMIKMN